MNRRIVFGLGVMAGLCVTAAALLFIRAGDDLFQYGLGDESYEELFEAVAGGEQDSTDEAGGNDRAMAEEEGGSGENPGLFSVSDDAADGGDAELPVIDFGKLKEINPDIVAWIYCPDTEINYPVVHGDGDDYYLNHLFDGTANKNGCLFMEAKNSPDFSDGNTIIYGHNMASGKMFAAVTGYGKQSFYDEHQTMYLITESDRYAVDVFSAYVSDASSDAYRIRFGGSDDFKNWIATVAKKSLFGTRISISPNDSMITLSTCSYEYKDARFVVHGRLRKL